MSKWRDIVKDPPPLGDPILATDGRALYEGKIVEVGDTRMLEGHFFDYGTEMRVPMVALTQWMPRTVRARTADEMFREMGYEKVNRTDGFNHWIDYVKRGSEESSHIDVSTPEHGSFGVVTGLLGDRKRGLSFNEVLACAQLIREMEAEDNVL